MDIKHATFKGGIHPNYHKEYTDKLPIEVMPAPKEVVISLAMHIGAPCTPVVAVGDTVKMGQLIGDSTAFVSANIFSSVSGKVTKIETREVASNQKAQCIIIENDFLDTLDESITPRSVKDLEPQEIVNIINDAGIVGLGGASFPTKVKFSPPPDVKIDYIIINGAECEPYLTSDHALMREEPKKLVEGLKLCMRALRLNNGYIGIEDNKQDAIDAVKAVCDDSIQVYSLHTKYPQGSEKQLINAITGREVASGALPSSAGCLIINSTTCIAIYDAVYNAMPLIEKICTVTGSGIVEPKVVKFRIGTMVNEVIDYCGGLTDDISKVILGGPMMGFAQYKTTVPTVKSTGGILCLNEKDAFVNPPSSCIRCGKCIGVCPIHLMPMNIAGYSAKGDFAKCEEYNALDCIECGSCAFTCPARRPLVASIRVAKRTIIANRKKNG